MVNSHWFIIFPNTRTIRFVHFHAIGDCEVGKFKLSIFDGSLVETVFLQHRVMLSSTLKIIHRNKWKSKLFLRCNSVSNSSFTRTSVQNYSSYHATKSHITIFLFTPLLRWWCHWLPLAYTSACAWNHKNVVLLRMHLSSGPWPVHTGTWYWAHFQNNASRQKNLSKKPEFST